MRRYGVDAAVLYSDIVVPAHAVGFGIDVTPGTGPVADRPVPLAPPTSTACRALDPEADTAVRARDGRILVGELPDDVPADRPSPARRSPSPAT